MCPPYFVMDDMFSAVQAAADRTNAFNAEQAQINRDWQERMSNTAHQREMEDLRKAGLNPILSARQGASTPSGSSASGADASGSIAGLFGQLVSAQSAMAVANANNASARLIEEMREKHDYRIHQEFPSNLFGAIGSIANMLPSFNQFVQYMNQKISGVGFNRPGTNSAFGLHRGQQSTSDAFWKNFVDALGKAFGKHF